MQNGYCVAAVCAEASSAAAGMIAPQGEIADPGEVGDQDIQVLEPYLIGGLGQSVLRVRHEGWQRPLQVADLVDRERNEEAGATNYGSEQPEKYDRRRDRPWE